MKPILCLLTFVMSHTRDIPVEQTGDPRLQVWTVDTFKQRGNDCHSTCARYGEYCKVISNIGGFEISDFSKISSFLEQIRMEHIQSVCISKSQLFFDSICSIRILPEIRDIVEKPSVTFKIQFQRRQRNRREQVKGRSVLEVKV